MPWPKGRPREESTKQQTSATLRAQHRIPWSKGKSLSEETKAKIAAASLASRPNRYKPLLPEELAEDLWPWFCFGEQFLSPEGKSLRIWRRCSRCGERFHSNVSDIRSGLKRHGLRITGYCFRCAHTKGVHQRGIRRLPTGDGTYINAQGYVEVYMPDHPQASNGYVKQHRLVMEEILGRILDPREPVHHRNGKRDDNRPENLELWTLGHQHPPGVRVVDWVMDRLWEQPEIARIPQKYVRWLRSAMGRITQQSFDLR